MAVRSANFFAVYEVIEQSKFFDPDYYLRVNLDVAQKNLDPLVHFADCGAMEGRKPNFYFDSNWYAKQNPDVPAGGVQPLLHYLARGDAEGRRASLIFDTAWYRKTYQVPAEENALSNYLSNRRSLRFRPVPDFDPEHYANIASDVVAAEMDLFEHFIRYGYREGRNPSAEFSVQYYADRYLKGDLTRNPFLHYLAFKDVPGIQGRLPDRETTVPREVKRFSKPSPDFEEFRPLPPSAVRRAKLLTYYLPQFHPIPENDRWWGKGFTEWSYIGRGTPRFAGHYQPRAPRDLGYYSLDAVEPIRRQVDMARAASVFGFVFYFYWFNGKRLLEKPVEIFLADRTIDMPFCLMWANENWTRRWDGSENELLISQDYGADNDRALISEFARHFRDHRYIRIKGRPLLMIYRASLIPNAPEAIARWRELFHALYREDPIFVMGQTFTDTDPASCGCDGAIEFPPHKVTRNITPINAELEFLDHEFNGWVYRYDEIVAQSLAEPPPDYPLIKTAVPSWDNDSRRQGSGVIFTGSTPAKYGAWLSQLVDRARRNPFFGEPFVCVNAWNEWCEGAYLEPDQHFGAAYLNATGRAMTRLKRARRIRTARDTPRSIDEPVPGLAALSEGQSVAL